MKLPTRDEVEEYFVKYKVPDNIDLHCHTVNRVAVFIAEQLVASGEHIDLDVVDRLSLCHDLFKAIAIKDLRSDPKFKCHVTPEQQEFWKEMKEKYHGMHETQVFSKILGQEFEEFCGLMEHYGNHDVPTSQKSREEQIVHYADWRVFIDEIISLQERMDDLYKRYKQKIDNGKIDWQTRIADEFAVEKSLFANLTIAPEQLGEKLP